MSKDIFVEFKENSPNHIALHWDGKLTKDYLGNKFEDLFMVVFGSPDYINKKLLRVPETKQTTWRNAQAEASFELLQIWNLQDAVMPLVFDTASSNSGWKSAVKLLKYFVSKKNFFILLVETTYTNW